MGWMGRAGATTMVAGLLLAGCGSAEVRSAHPDPLCAAMDDLRAAGMAAALSGIPRVLGDEQDAADADRRAARARAALARFREEAPDDLASDAATVTLGLERWIGGLNNPGGRPVDLVAASGSTPEERDAFRHSARKVNAVTVQRCGDHLVDPTELGAEQG